MKPTRTPKLAPYLLAKDAQSLVDFIERGIGGRVAFEARRKDGTLSHVEVIIADSVLMLAEPSRGRQGFPAMLHLYVEDADEAYERALREGARSVSPPVDEADGDRRCAVVDNWGNEWWFTKAPKA